MKNLLLALRLALREMKGSLRHFRILLVCLVLGVAAIAGVQSMTRSLMDSLRHDGRYILGGDLSVRTLATPVEDRYLEEFRGFGEVTISMETHAMIRDDDESASMLAELKAIDAAYPLYGQARFVDGDGREMDKTPQQMVARGEDGLHGAAVERDVLTQMGLAVGDVIRVGRDRLRITGIITHEPDRLGSSRFSISPRVMMDYGVIADAGFTEFGNQIYYHHRLKIPEIQTLTDLEETRAYFEDMEPEDMHWRVYSFLDAAPGLRRAVERLNIFLTLMGLTALLIGGIGIGNATVAYLQRKYDVIASFKCLGGAQQTVFLTYFIQMILVAVPGVAAGVAIGAALPQFVTPLITDRLELTARVGVYPDILALAAVYGFLIAAMFVIWPVAKACRVRAADLFRSRVMLPHNLPERRYLAVIAALVAALIFLIFFTVEERRMAEHFLVFSVVSLFVFMLLSALIRFVARRIRIRNAPALRMAVANLYRPGNTTTSVLMSMGFGMAVMVMIAMLEANFSTALQRDAHEETPAFYFLDVQDEQIEEFTEIVMATPSARNFQLMPILRGRVVSAKGIPSEEALVREEYQWVMRGDRRFTYTATAPPHGEIAAGEWWPEDYDGPLLVSVSRDVALAFDAGVGDKLTVEILGQRLDAEIANIRDIRWTSFTMNFAMTFSPGILEMFPANYIATVVVDEGDEIDLQNRLARAMPNVTSVRLRDVLDTAQNLMGLVAQAVRYGAAVTIIVGLLVLQGGILSGQQQRLYDTVILKVLGVGRRKLGAVFLVEYGVLAFVVMLVAGVLGTMLSYGVFAIIMDMVWRFSFRALLEISLLCVILTLAIGYLNIRHTLSYRPAAFLRRE